MNEIRMALHVSSRPFKALFGHLPSWQIQSKELKALYAEMTKRNTMEKEMPQVKMIIKATSAIHMNHPIFLSRVLW